MIFHCHRYYASVSGFNTSCPLKTSPSILGCIISFHNIIFILNAIMYDHFLTILQNASIEQLKTINNFFSHLKLNTKS